MLYEQVLSPERLASIIIIAKRTLFPNGYPAAAPPDPTQEEQVAMKEALVERIMGMSSRAWPFFVSPPFIASCIADTDRILHHPNFNHFVLLLMWNIATHIAFVSTILLGTTPSEQKRTIEELVDPLSNQACNAHLLVCILDAFLLALFPELGGEEDTSSADTSARSGSPSDGGGGGRSGNGDGTSLDAGFGLGGGEVRSMEGESEGEDGRGVERGTGAGAGRVGSGADSILSV